MGAAPARRLPEEDVMQRRLDQWTTALAAVLIVGALLGFLAFTVYSPVIALLGMFMRPDWKGRRT